ncbi:MAG: hypothetical protein AB9907_17875 [Flexilinea sp.]
MLNAPILGPYGDKPKDNVPIVYSFDSRDVISDELKQTYDDIHAIEMSIDIMLPKKNPQKTVKQN